MASFKLKFLPYQHYLVIALLINILLPGRILAQQTPPTQYTQHHFTDEDGLPQNTIKSMVLDVDGFVWLTTESGLVRYDGQNFLTFNNSVMPVRSSRMGSFYPTNKISGKDSNYFFALSDATDYVEIKEGKAFWKRAAFEDFMATMPFYGEYTKVGAFIGQSLPNRFKQTMTQKICIIPDDAGGSYVCARETISYYKGKKEEYKVDFPSNDFWSYFRLGGSLFWADDKGRFKEIEKDTVRNIELTGDIDYNPVYKPGTRNFEIYWNNATGEAFLYLQKSLYLLKPAGGNQLEAKLILTNFDCEINNIISICYDEASRMVFLGSLNKGLFTFSPKQFRTLSYGNDEKDNVYYAMMPWKNDRVLTAQGNIIGATESLALPAIKEVAGLDRYSILTDKSGFIWTKSGNYVNKFDREGKKLIARWNLGGELNQLYKGNDGKVWIGSEAMGLYKIDPDDPHAIPVAFPTRAFLKSISCLQQEGTDTLWVGTHRGLYRLHLPTGKVDTMYGLEQSYVRSLYISEERQMWITTFQSGFFLYSNHRLTRFPVDKGEYLLTSHCITEDQMGFLWITTNKGLFQVAKKDLLDYAQGGQDNVYYFYHARDEGFATNEFNGGCQPCAVKLLNGSIALPSLAGVVWFSPETLKTSLPDKRIFIDRIEVDQVVVQPTDSLVLPRGFKLLKLYCTTPYLGNAYNIKVEYAWIKGKEEPVWLNVDKDMVISHSSLEHGVYMLVIRKTEGFGGNSYSYRRITFIVPPAFYETYWFYGIVLVSFLFLFWTYARLRLRYINRKNRQLETMVDERTEELSKALGALSVSEQNIRRQMHVRQILLTAMSHDIGSPLKYITMMAEELKNGLEPEPIPMQLKKHADDIFKSGYYLYHLTRNLLQYQSVYETNSAVQYEKLDLHQLIEKKAAIFQPIALERAVTIINTVPEKFTLYCDPLLLEVIIHNLFDNAIKATRAGNVTVRVSTIGIRIYLIIDDTGSGMREEVANYYSDDLSGKEEDTRLDSHHFGFGLKIVKELTRLIDVKLRIETSAKGTSVLLIFTQATPEKR